MLCSNAKCIWQPYRESWTKFTRQPDVAKECCMPTHDFFVSCRADRFALFLVRVNESAYMNVLLRHREGRREGESRFPRYLQSGKELSNECIHLLFSSNRWETQGLQLTFRPVAQVVAQRAARPAEHPVSHAVEKKTRSFVQTVYSAWRKRIDFHLEQME